MERFIEGTIGDCGEAYMEVPAARDDPILPLASVDASRVGEYAGDSEDGERARSSIVGRMVATYCSGVRTKGTIHQGCIVPGHILGPRVLYVEGLWYDT